MAIYAIDFDNTLAITRFPEIIALVLCQDLVQVKMRNFYPF